MDSWARRRASTAARGLALTALALTGPVLFLVYLLGLCIATCGLVSCGQWVMQRCRALLNLSRRVAGQWSGIEITVPYWPQPEPPTADADGWYRENLVLYRTPRVPHYVRRVRWLGEDPATGRDLDWMLLNPLIGSVLGLLTVAGGEPVLRLNGRWTRFRLGPAPSKEQSSWLGVGLFALWRLLLLIVLAVVNLLSAALVLVLGVLAHLTVTVVALPSVVELNRKLIATNRRLARDWSGVHILDPYPPAPSHPKTTEDGYYRVGRFLSSSAGSALRHQRYRWVIKDPATWRDLLWQLGDIFVICMLTLPLGCLFFFFWWGVGVQPWVAVAGLFIDTGLIWESADAGVLGWLSDNPLWSVPAGLVAGVLILVLAPRVLRAHGWWARLLLAPTRRALLAGRVQRLTETRAEATEEELAGLRRIERDLHDGTQARLVALGVKLAAVEHLLERDPQRAKMLLTESREDSGHTLAELRDLVHGIRPPVLAERGLADAVRALALDTPVPVEVHVDLAGRCPPSVESGVYFAVRELITNVLKHTAADVIDVELSHSGAMLSTKVTDNGQGGADPDRGSGLLGIRRRLGTFDGTLELSSPTGGPTKVTMVVPCVLSSPKTSSSSETA